MPSIPIQCMGMKAEHPDQGHQKWIRPSFSSYIRPVIFGNQ